MSLGDSRGVDRLGDRPDGLALALLDFQAFPGRYSTASREPRVLFDQQGRVLALAAGRSVEGLPADAELEQGLREAARFFVRAAMLRQGADHYTLLGLSREFDPATLREHYRMLIRLTHPDFSAGSDHWPADAATRINQANDVLASPEKRLLYDKALRAPVRIEAPRPSRYEPTARRQASARLAERRRVWPFVLTGAAAALLLMVMFWPADPLHERLAQLANTPVPASDTEAAGSVAVSNGTAVIRPAATKVATSREDEGGSNKLATAAVPVASSPVEAPIVRAMASGPVAAVGAISAGPAPIATVVQAAPVPRTEPAPRTTVVSRTTELPPPAPAATQRVALPPPLLRASASAVVAQSGPPIASTQSITAGLKISNTMAPLPEKAQVATGRDASSMPARAAIPAAPAVVAAVAHDTAPPAQPAVVIAAVVPRSPAPSASAITQATAVSGLRMADVQPLLAQLLGALQSGRGEQAVRLVERSSRTDGDARFVEAYNRTLAGSRVVRLGQVQFAGKNGGEQLVVDGVVQLQLQDETLQMVTREFVLRALFASRAGQPVMTQLIAGAGTP